MTRRPRRTIRGVHCRLLVTYRQEPDLGLATERVDDGEVVHARDPENVPDPESDQGAGDGLPARTDLAGHRRVRPA
jgi:hypothetical protein